MKKYRVQRGDTLESIAKHLGITYLELRGFHNRHCELQHLLGDKIPSSLKEILYQSKEDTIRQDIYNLEKESRIKLTLEPDSKNRTYGVQISSFEGEEEYSLKYTVQVQWLQRNLVRIYREELSVDEKELDMMVDKLSYSLSACLYPLEFFVNSSGELTGIHNYPEIKKRWSETKQQLKEYYVGDTEKEYIQLAEHTVSNSDLLFLKLKKEWFLQAFFSGLYGFYDLKENSKTRRSFPILPSIKALEYTTLTQIKTIEENSKKMVKIEFKGETSDKRSLANIENGMDFGFPESEEDLSPAAVVKGEYQAVYFLDPAHYTLSSLYLECTLELGKNKKVRVMASQFEEVEKNRIIKEEEIIEIVKSSNLKAFFLIETRSKKI